MNWVRPPPHKPLDLSSSHEPQRFPFNGNVESNTIDYKSTSHSTTPCVECKELRKEVREVRDNLNVLMEQFTTFAGSWNQKFVQSSSATTPEIPDSSTAKSSGSIQSPPSSASSGGDEVTSNNPVNCRGDDVTSNHPVSFGRIVHSKDNADRSSPASSNTSNASSNNSDRKRKIGKNVEGLNNPLASPLNVTTDNHPTLKRPRTNLMPPQNMHHNFGINPNIGLHHQNPLGMGSSLPCQSLPPAAWSLLWGLPGWSPTPHNPYQQMMHPHSNSNPFVNTTRPMMNLGDPYKKGVSPSPPSSGDGSNSPKHLQAPPENSVLRPTPMMIGQRERPPAVPAGMELHQNRIKMEQNVPLAPTSHAASLQTINSSYAVASNASKTESNAPIEKDKVRKRPGPDDFIKEFLELEMSQEEVKGKVYDIPVPEAVQHDPNFQPVSEDEILRSCRWEELDWQESVTRLAKKLAEKRVFGPALMSRTTVAGSNHSNYPNLPLEGIMYIESVCRRVLFPGMSRRQFAEFFRPAIKGLAARCRRIRHSLKPSPTGDSPPHAEYKKEEEEEEETLVVEDETVVVGDVYH